MKLFFFGSYFLFLQEQIKDIIIWGILDLSSSPFSADIGVACEMVWFDETAAVERKLRRRYGWGVVGEELHTFVPHIVRYTLGETMTVDGRGFCAVVPGSLDRVGFLTFMLSEFRVQGQELCGLVL
jgi:hypothetical protein